MAAFVEFKNVSKVYNADSAPVHALRDVSFTVEKGELCVILGQSGAGKTTLLNILGGMDVLTSGQIYLNGEEISSYGKKRLAEYRRREIGFVFQFYNLIPNLTALENVEIATQLNKNSMDSAAVLEQVGLKERMGNFPAQLSGGEQQRVAIARAIAKNPQLLLCDEPTGALDYETGKSILHLLQQCCREQGMTVIIITHNSALAPMADRIIRIKNGSVASVARNDTPASIDEIEW